MWKAGSYSGLPIDDQDGWLCLDSSERSYANSEQARSSCHP
jgi:hypothetical protein